METQTIIKSNSRSEWLINLGVILRELRLKKGFTSAEAFAFNNDLNRSIYQKWETGSNMELKSLSRLSQIHNLRPSELLRLAEEKMNRRRVIESEALIDP